MTVEHTAVDPEEGEVERKDRPQGYYEAGSYGVFNGHFCAASNCVD
jgi:hypothetical protein